MANDDVWVFGCPGPVGGASTELDHQIDLWRMHGLAVHLLRHGRLSQEWLDDLEERGVRVHDYDPRILSNRTVLAFCNGEFLRQLRIIRQYAERIIWVGTMCVPPPEEIECHRHHLIDLCLYQSDYQRNRCEMILQGRLGWVPKGAGFRSYINPDRFEFEPDRRFGHFAIGNLGRADLSKRHPRLLELVGRIKAPGSILFRAMGWPEAFFRDRGPVPPPDDRYRYEFLKPNAMPVADFYRWINVLLHWTGGSEENWPRVLLECYATGVVFLGENEYGIREMAMDGHTAMLASRPDVDAGATYQLRELATKATVLAFDAKLRKRIALDAREFLVDELANSSICWADWEDILFGGPAHEHASIPTIGLAGQVRDASQQLGTGEHEHAAGADPGPVPAE